MDVALFSFSDTCQIFGHLLELAKSGGWLNLQGVALSFKSLYEYFHFLRRLFIWSYGIQFRQRKLNGAATWDSNISPRHTTLIYQRSFVVFQHKLFRGHLELGSDHSFYFLESFLRINLKEFTSGFVLHENLHLSLF